MGAPVNFEGGPDHLTPLLAAAQACSLPALQMLLEAGADPGLATKTGATPLRAAALAGDVAAIEALAAAGAPLDQARLGSWLWLWLWSDLRGSSFRTSTCRRSPSAPLFLSLFLPLSSFLFPAHSPGAAAGNGEGDSSLGGSRERGGRQRGTPPPFTRSPFDWPPQFLPAQF